MYKMEFFTDSYESAYSESHSSLQPSQLSEVEDARSKSGWDKPKKPKNESKLLKDNSASEEYTGEALGVKSVSQMLKMLG